MLSYRQPSTVIRSPDVIMRPTTSKTSVRRPAVAGLFYPADERELREQVSGYLRQAPGTSPATPKALIVPHAGYIYSGGIAAAGYALIAPQRQIVRRVVLVGPSHRVYLRGGAVPQVDAFETPLGRVRIDEELRNALLARNDVLLSDEPHALEHSLEVQLPFLQILLDEFTLLPIVLGAASPAYVSSLLRDVWGGPETLVLASSDLSHYHGYDDAQRIDAATSAAILRYDTSLTGDQACGAVAINGLLQLSHSRRLPIAQIARCNSGDTAGDRARVVGYGAFSVQEPAQPI
jgi:AmmeMemoRadiSam system protein B